MAAAGATRGLGTATALGETTLGRGAEAGGAGAACEDADGRVEGTVPDAPDAAVPSSGEAASATGERGAGGIASSPARSGAAGEGLGGNPTRQATSDVSSMAPAAAPTILER